jgi:electron transfer flavoprotein beta subunit
VKILVALKRVADPDNANKVRISAGGERIETGNLEWKLNPFDEYALEAALRLTEDGKAPKQRLGEVVAVSLGPKEVETTLRSALATGADRALRIEAEDDKLDGRLVALALQKVVLDEKPDLVLMGKQAVDGDSNQVGQILAELLDYPMATFAATIEEEASGSLKVSALRAPAGHHASQTQEARCQAAGGARLRHRAAHALSQIRAAGTAKGGRQGRQRRGAGE